MSSVQKILDEIHLSRVQLENDKKAGEKARVEYEEFVKKIKTLREQHNESTQKLTEVYKSIAVRSIDVNLYTRKLEIVKLKKEELKVNIDSHSQQLKKLLEEYSSKSEWLLQNSIKFANLWNCTEHGYEQRKIHHQGVILDLKAKKVQLEHDLDEFMTMQKKIEDSKAELLEVEAKYQQHEQIMDIKEKELYKEMDRVGEILSSMLKKKEEIDLQRSDELNKILKQIEMKKDTITKLQLRGTKLRSIVENQRMPPQSSYWPANNKPDSSSNATQRHQFTQDTRKEQINSSRIYQQIKPTQSMHPAGFKFHVVPTNSEENEIPESAYAAAATQGTASQKENSKGPKIFHFKKSPATAPNRNEFVSGRTVYQSKYGQ